MGGISCQNLYCRQSDFIIQLHKMQLVICFWNIAKFVGLHIVNLLIQIKVLDYLINCSPYIYNDSRLINKYSEKMLWNDDSLLLFIFII